MLKLDHLLKKEMTRKQFLATLCGAFVSVFGFASLVGMLTKEEQENNSGLPGYGERGYGP